MPSSRGSRRRNSISRSSVDRKSTRLNSSHLVISYAVFCLKKKKGHCPAYEPPLSVFNVLRPELQGTVRHLVPCTTHLPLPVQLSSLVNHLLSSSDLEHLVNQRR